MTEDLSWAPPGIDAGSASIARGTARSRAAIERFFDGFTVLDPGLARLPEWRPDQAADVPAGVDLSLVLAGAGRRP